MAKETKEERRLRIQKEVADESAARREAYLKAQEESKAKATAAAPPLPKPDAYVYDYTWRQGVGTPEGQLKLIKSPNAYYDASTNTIVDPATGERTDATQSMVSGASTSSDALYDAKRAAGYGIDAQGKPITTSSDSLYASKYAAGYGMDTQGNQYRGAGTQGDPLTINGSPFTGTWQGKTYQNGLIKTSTTSSVTTQPIISTGLDSATLELIKSLQTQIANLTTGNAATAAATKAAEKLAERQSAFDVLRAEMDALGLGALVEPLRGLIQKDVSPSEFAVELRQSEAYKNRFIANEGRLKKGLRVLTPGEYLRVEDAYRQTLRTYGLKQFDNDQYVRQFIENDISAAELSDRVATAVQRVQNADPAIGRTLRDYYGIGQTDLVAYVLDPNQQLQKIQRQVAAAEIGVAARKQGLEAGVTVAEQLATQGITEAQAQKGYATIADILPTSEKLSQIYGTTLEGYGQAEAEQEVFNTLASAQRKRQRLVGREIAEFSGQSGLGRGSLGTATGGQY